MLRLKAFLARACLLTLCVYSPQLFAAEVRSNSETNTQRDLTSDEIDQIKQMLFNQPLKPYSVNPYGLLQGNFNFADTSRTNTPDFNVSHARLGVLAVENNWSGKLEVEFVGNQPNAAVPKDSPLYLTQSGNNTVVVRQAQINFDFYKHTTAPAGKSGVEKRSGEPTPASAITDEPQSINNTYISRMSIGGIRVGGAGATSPDSANNPTGFGRQDGFYLVENMAIGKSNTANLGFGLFNNLLTSNAGPLGKYQGWAAYPGTAPNFLGILGVKSSGFSKAFLFNGNYSRKFSPTSYLFIAGFYGFQNQEAVKTNENGFATTIRNANHIEASALYNDSSIFGDKALLSGNGITLSFEDEIGTDQRKTGAAPEGTVAPQDGYNHRWYGISLGGDTSGYFSGVFKDADRFLYSASINYVDARFKHSAYSNNYTVTQFAGAIGYGYKTLEMVLVTAYSTSPQKTFAHFNANTGIYDSSPTNNNFEAYFTAALYF